MKKSILVAQWVLALLIVASCVTVNIYFPAAKVEKTAEDIVNDVYANPEKGTAEQETEEQSFNARRALVAVLSWFGPDEACAQDATSVSNAAIRGLKNEIAQNHQQLAPFYNQGNVGINNAGLLEIRNTQGLPMPQLAKLKQLVNADNAARRQLYSEVAKALNIDPAQVAKVQKIFADQWRSKAQSGWLIQEDSGAWVKK